MHSRPSSGLFLGIICALVAVRAAAADPGLPQKSGYDPNERICENITLTGSRLGVKRFCATRAEWEDRRRQDRDEVDKAQRSPCVIQTTGASGRPGC
jgi:hypothetical protein